LVAAAGAEQPKIVPVVGILMVATGPDDALIEALREGLRELGYVEGQNIRFEYRGAQGHVERLPLLARELVQLKADAILVGAGASIRAVKQATSTIPILAVVYDEDPVSSGLIESFNRPGGNITGIYQRQLELAGKRLELLKEALPGLSRVAVFWDPCCPGELAELKPAARSLGIKLELIELRAPYDLETAFRIAKQKKAGAVIVLFSSVFYSERARIGALGLKGGLPVMSQLRDTTQAGGFMSYGHEFRDSWFRFAYFIDRLLKGANPAEMPVEQVATFKLVVNLRTAKALGLVVPATILLRTDEVIR
jgi:putative ABC transport system substrate-binding protein